MKRQLKLASVTLEGLDQETAVQIRDYLVAGGVAANRMVAKGYGESNPVADNGTREGRAKNRRVELEVID